VFYLLYEVSSELLLIHSAVYINQNFIQTQSKRLMPVILAGHQIGVIAGGVFLASVSPLLGVVNMMLVWTVLLLLAYLVIRNWHVGHGVSPYFRAGSKGRSKISQSINQITQGLKFMKRSRLLSMSSFSLFFMVVSVYILAYSVNVVYTENFESEEALSSFFGALTAITAALALLIQLFVTNRLIRDLGIKRVNYIFPLTSIFSYAGLLAAFALPAAVLASFNKETLMPAFAKPVRNIFNATLPMQLQGRGQAIAVIIVIPLGLAFAGLLLLLAQGMQNIYAFLVIGLICSIAYLFFNRAMNRAYAKEILSNLKKSLFVPEQYANSFLKGNHEDLIKDIEQGLMSQDDDIGMVYARVLSESDPQRAAKLISARMDTSDNAVKDRLIKIVGSVEAFNLNDRIRKEIGCGDAHLDATILKTLFKARDNDAKSYVIQLLNDENPRIKAAGVYGALRYPMPSLIEEAIAAWMALLKNVQVDNYMPAVELIVPEFKILYQSPPLLGAVQQKLREMLQHEDSNFIQIALKILATWPPEGMDTVEDILLPLSTHQNWMIRKGCINTVHLLPDKTAGALLLAALEDPHPNVRIAAVKTMASSQVDEIYYIHTLLIEKHVGSPRAKQAMLEYLMDSGCDARTMNSIGLALAHEAVNLKLASRCLAESEVGDGNMRADAVATLLAYALEERVMEVADLSLNAVQSSNNDEAIAVIRVGLKSNDKRQFSNAFELLSMLNNPALLELIIPLFDENVAIDNFADKNTQFNSLSALLGWVRERSDPWLSECARGLSETLSDQCHV
ncbi:MAG: HEAT repeat domain-containing protein, partial [Gammaproteobacteria bacterium]